VSVIYGPPKFDRIDSLGLVVFGLTQEPFCDCVRILKDTGLEPGQSRVCLSLYLLSHL